MLQPGSPNLNSNQFKPLSAIGGAASGLAKGLTNAGRSAERTFAPAAKAVGNMARGAAGGLERSAVTAVKAAPFAAAGPAVAAGAAAYGASQTPGGRSIIKGAVQGAKGPNKGVAGPAGAIAGAVKGAATSQGAKNVASGVGRGALIGALGGPVGAAIGAGVGLVGGLFSNRGMQKKAAPAAGAAVPNRATPYVVKKGDTLTSIAAANKTTVANLRKANPTLMNNPKYNKGNMIWSGTKVNLS